MFSTKISNFDDQICVKAIKALKEEGIDTVVINPNVATVQVKQYMQNQQNICKTRNKVRCEYQRYPWDSM